MDIVTPGEVINVSLCGATNANTVSVTILDPAGGTVYSSGTVASNVDCADPLTAPLALPFRYTAATSGTYTVRLENVSGGADIKRFDITVTPDAMTNPDPSAAGGRLWAYGWDFYTRSFAESASTFADYYALVPGGRPNTNYVWKLDLNNFSGNLYNLVANDLGLNPPYSGYSVPVASGSVTEKFPLYLNYPTVANPRPTEPPVLSGGLRFVDDNGVDYGISPDSSIGVQDSGVFEFNADVGGTYAITIDTNQDGVFGAGDKLLLGNMTAGLNQVAWDGTGPDGTVLPYGTYRAGLQARLGEYHFVAKDVETSGGTLDGLTIYLANVDGSTVDTMVYWDDATYLGGGSILPDGRLASTPEGKHTWGNFATGSIGDNAFIDTYVYGLASAYTAVAAVVADDTPLTGVDGVLTSTAQALPGGTITFSVADADINVLSTVIEYATVVVVNGRTGEQEQLTLTESGVDTGVFTLDFPTTDNASVGTNNDGSMNVQQGDTLTITYQDQLDAVGNSVNRTANTLFGTDSDGDGILDSSDL
ncbi:MAG TPA: hypothetical protein VGB35_01630, partial [Gammaproteobacteria bacterium]